MPIAVGTGVIVAPPTVPIVPPTPVDLPSATWIDPHGVVWPLTSPDFGWFTTDGVAGIQDVVSVTISTDAEDGGGETVRYVYPGSRLITWPLFVEGSDHTEFIGRWRALAKAFASTTRRGAGTLQIARPDGSVRQIRAYYSDGFDGDPAMGGIRADLAAMTLRCPNGYWQAVDVETITRTGGAGAGHDFLDQFMTVSSSAVLGATTVVNPGDVPAYPVWTLTGPLATFTATLTYPDGTTAAWTLDAVTYRGSALIAGETVVVTTKPQTIIGPDGSDWTGALSWPSPVLWPLDDGANAISFAATGSTSDTSIVGTYVPLFETA